MIDGRAYFRLDVIAEAGADGNAFTIEASLSPDRSEPAPDVRLFAHQATVRWRERTDPTEVRFAAPEGARLRLPEFRRGGRRDRAGLDLRRGAAQGVGAGPVDGGGSSTRRAARSAITLRGGMESPNDVTLALFDAAGKPVDLEMPPRPARRRCGRWPWRWRGRSRTARRSRSTPRVRPGRRRWVSRGISGMAAQRAGGAGASLRRPGHYEAELRGARARRPDGARGDGRVPVHVRPAPVAVAAIR